MLAVIAAVLFALAAFGVHVGGLNLIALGLAFLALHLAYPWTPWVRNPQ